MWQLLRLNWLKMSSVLAVSYTCKKFVKSGHDVLVIQLSASYPINIFTVLFASFSSNSHRWSTCPVNYNMKKKRWRYKLERFIKHSDVALRITAPTKFMHNNRATRIKHQWRKTTVLSYHRCLINPGVMNNI